MTLVQDNSAPTGVMWPQVYYHEARRNIVATATRSDGYNGDHCKVGIAWVDGWAIAVTDVGAFRFSERKYQDAREMLYYLREHTRVFNSSVFSVDAEVDQAFVEGLPSDW